MTKWVLAMSAEVNVGYSSDASSTTASGEAKSNLLDVYAIVVGEAVIPPEVETAYVFGGKLADHVFKRSGCAMVGGAVVALRSVTGSRALE